MKIQNLFTIILCLLFINSCSPKLSSSYKSPNYQSKNFKKIAVVGIGNDTYAKNAFENEAVRLLRANGINAIEGRNIFNSFKEYTEEESVKLLKNANVDGVITMALVNENQSQRYVPGRQYSVPTGYYRFGRYFYRTYSYVSEPGYYQNEDRYLIEAVLYDLEITEGDAVAWIGQSELVNPTSSDDAAETFTKQMVVTLVSNEVIKP